MYLTIVRCRQVQDKIEEIEEFAIPFTIDDALIDIQTFIEDEKNIPIPKQFMWSIKEQQSLQTAEELFWSCLVRKRLPYYHDEISIERLYDLVFKKVQIPKSEDITKLLQDICSTTVSTLNFNHNYIRLLTFLRNALRHNNLTVTETNIHAPLDKIMKLHSDGKLQSYSNDRMLVHERTDSQKIYMIELRKE